MRKWLSRAIVVLGGIFAVVNFMATTSPEDARTRTAAWLNLPIVRSLPDWIIAFLSSPVTLSITGVVVGWWLGWKARGFLEGGPAPSPTRHLGTEVSNLAYDVDNMRFMAPHNDLIAELNVLQNKLAGEGFAVPPGGVLDPQQMSRYLHGIAAFLKRDDLPNAKATANRIVRSWKSQTDASGQGFLGHG